MSPLNDSAFEPCYASAYSFDRSEETLWVVIIFISVRARNFRIWT
jgi:hypothetical protein